MFTGILLIPLRHSMTLVWGLKELMWRPGSPLCLRGVYLTCRKVLQPVSMWNHYRINADFCYSLLFWKTYILPFTINYFSLIVSVSEVQELQPLRHAGEYSEGSQRRLAEVLPGARYTWLCQDIHIDSTYSYLGLTMGPFIHYLQLILSDSQGFVICKKYSNTKWAVHAL